jgi:uncharacterized integral membrane protein
MLNKFHNCIIVLLLLLLLLVLLSIKLKELEFFYMSCEDPIPFYLFLF